MDDKFKQQLEKLGIKPYEIKFVVGGDVYDTLQRMRKDNEMTMEDFMRAIVDFFIEGCDTN